MTILKKTASYKSTILQEVYKIHTLVKKEILLNIIFLKESAEFHIRLEDMVCAPVK